MNTINYTISRVRNSLKAVKEDAFITDRYIWSLIIKYAKLYIKKQDNLNKLLRFKSFYKTLPCLELIEVDKIEANCGGIRSGCKIMRTKDPIPKPFDGPTGPMFRTVSSIDGSIEVYQTEPGTYTSMTKTTTFKYNKSKYFWYLNGHLYFPNIEWEAIQVEGIWEGDIVNLNNDGICVLRQDQESSIPDDLYAEIEKAVLSEIYPTASIPQDQTDDKQNVYR
jgi:hypothetical protein